MIINSLLDTDFYKITMGQLVFHDFPNVDVKYEFINRGNTEFPTGFAYELRHQIKFLSTLKLTEEEFNYIKRIPGIRPTYAEWLKNYQFNPDEVTIKKDGGKLFVSIKGPWYRTIFWEVPLMAIISELYYVMINQREPKPEYKNKVNNKSYKLEKDRCLWNDFGTRRRFSYKVQDFVVETMKQYLGFMGTSNVHFAMKYNKKPIGTSAHEMVMGLSAIYGVKNANNEWMKHWSNFYKGLYGIALTDTFTTDVFLRDFDGYYARFFDGVRHDSGNPVEWGYKILNHYGNIRINPEHKKLIFSDGLTDDKLIDLTRQFRNEIVVMGGIGTFLTNDVGYEPLNIVIKMTSCKYDCKYVDVVKLSDDEGKHTGNPEEIKRIKKELDIF